METRTSKPEANEQDWLKAVERIFAFAATQNPPAISQSEVEALLIGLKGQETRPLVGKPLSPQGKKAVEMLQGYLDVMKKKKKRFLPIKK